MVRRMPTVQPRREVEDLERHLREVQTLLERHGPVEQLMHSQQLAELRGRLDRLHAADIAFILEALPVEDRLVVWDLVKADRDGEILLDLPYAEDSRAEVDMNIVQLGSGRLVEVQGTGESGTFDRKLLDRIPADAHPNYSHRDSLARSLGRLGDQSTMGATHPFVGHDAPA